MLRTFVTAALLACAGAVAGCLSASDGHGPDDDGGPTSADGSSGGGSGSGGSGSGSDASGSSSGMSGPDSGTASSATPPDCAPGTVTMVGFPSDGPISGSRLSQNQDTMNVTNISVSEADMAANASNSDVIQIAVIPAFGSPLAAGQVVTVTSNNEVALNLTDRSGTQHQCILASGQADIGALDTVDAEASVGFAGRCTSNSTPVSSGAPDISTADMRGKSVSGCMNTFRPDGGM